MSTVASAPARDGRARRRAALTHPGTWLGFLGSCLLAIGTVAGRDITGNFSTFKPFLLVRAIVEPDVANTLSVFGVAFLLLAFLLLRPTAPRGPVAYRWVLALWTLPLLVAPPVESKDVYAYLDGGWQFLNGYSPYDVGLSGAGGPFVRVVDVIWRTTPVNYPPGSVLFQAAAVWLGHNHVITSVWAMRLFTVAATFLISWGVPRLARHVRMSVDRAVYLAILNPIVIVDQIGGAHNDGLMAAVAVLACVVACRRGLAWWLLASVLAGVAALCKQPGLWVAVVVTMLAFPTARWLKRLGMLAISSLIAVGTFVLGTLATGLGFGWLAGMALPGAVDTIAPLNTLVVYASSAINHNLWPLAKNLCYVPILTSFAWLIARRWRFPFTVAAGGWLAYAFFGAGLHAWYLLAATPFLGLIRLRPATSALLKVACAYVVVAGAFSEIAGVLPIRETASIALGLSMLGVWGWEALRRWRRAQLTGGATTVAPERPSSGASAAR